MKKYLSLSFLFLLLIPLSAQTPKRFNYGIYSGWSYGTSYEFKTNNHGRTESRNTPKYHLGTYLQYNFNQNFALQVNVNLQPIKYEHKFKVDAWGDDGNTHKDYSITSFTLSTVITSKEYNNAKLYFLSGLGLSLGTWGDDWPEDYYNMTLEPGAKFYFFKSKPNIAFKLGLSLHHLRGAKSRWGTKDTYSATYIRLNFGIEL